MPPCSSTQWHAARWPGSYSLNAGTSTLQRSNAIGQRVWKRQPEGGLTGEGMSPLMMIRLRRRSTTGSGIGIAESSAWV